MSHQSLKALALLLTYPDEDLQRSVGDLDEALGEEPAFDKTQHAALADLLTHFANEEPMALQEQYIQLFDRSRALSLHLFEHVHGESRARGQAMIDLKDAYEAHGLLIAQNDLPDYLPMFLEFLSEIEEREAREYLGQVAHILSALEERLRKRQSDYAALFSALLALARAKPSAEDIAAVIPDADADPDDLEALDRDWEEVEVTFGPGAANTPGACGSDALAARMRHAKRAQPALPVEPNVFANPPATPGLPSC